MITKVFPFRLPKTLLTGLGSVEKVGLEASKLGAKKVLIITDKGINKAGLTDIVKGVLNKSKIEVEIYTDVEPEPSIESLQPCLDIVKENGFDVLIGLGGGSSIDTTKAISILATNGGRINDYFGIDKIPKPGLPTIMIPTTSGTGAEVTPNAIFTDKENQVKKGVVSPFLLPDVSIVDPQLTIGLPPSITAATGMDALTHAIESYTSLKATYHTDMYALEAIKLISSNLRKAVWCGSDITAREKMALGSCFAGISLANAGVGAVHALAYPVGGQFHVPHGVANALLLPYVLEYNVTADVYKFAKVCEAMGENIKGLSIREAAEKAVDAVKQLSKDVAIPQKMKEVGVVKEAIDGMAKIAASNERLMGNNIRKLSEAEVKEIYIKAFE